MVFVEHKYGNKKKEIKLLLRNRLIVRERLRYYQKQLNKYKQKEIDLENQIKEEFDFVKGKF